MKPPAAADDVSAFRLVTRLFLRRLIDNDLISPHADRHESLAMVYGLVLSLAVFATFFMCTNYLAAFIQLPGPAALSALADRFLFIAASITISALAALMVWDALALEPRDAAILGPLPVPARIIARAKLAAAVIFGAVLIFALNAAPSVLYPLFLTMNIRGTSGATILRLIAGHATTVTIAGFFGFFGILALRGVFRALVGEEIFRRLSSTVQGALVVGMVTALLLAPTVRATAVRNWVSHAARPRWPAVPVLWYLGVNERLAGHLLNETPIVPPPRVPLLAIRTQGDQAARAMYRGLVPRFAALARRAYVSSSLVTAVAVAAFIWTNRRLPDRSAGVPAPSRLRASVRGAAERHARNDPEAQAGFFFALQTLTRSAPHRTIIAIGVAIGLTHALVVLAQGGIHQAEVGSASSSSSVFAISIMMLTSFVAAFSCAVTVPAAPAASWAIRMAWGGDERRYLAGVKRAAMVLVVALLVALLPLHVALLGTGMAVLHSLVDLLFAAAGLDAMFLSCRKVPFACSYVPLENPKLVWLAGFASLLVVTYGFAKAERWGLETPARAIALAVTLAAAAYLVRAIDSARRHERFPLKFDQRPTPATQRLGLFEHITIQD